MKMKMLCSSFRVQIDRIVTVQHDLSSKSVGESLMQFIDDYLDTKAK